MLNETLAVPFHDVLVYGGTAGGAMAAIAAAEAGRRVALVEPGQHIGGMLSVGLSRTDMDRQYMIMGQSAGVAAAPAAAANLPVQSVDVAQLQQRLRE